MRRSLVLFSGIPLSYSPIPEYNLYSLYYHVADGVKQDRMGDLALMNEREAPDAKPRTCPHGYDRNLFAAWHPARRAARRTRPRRPRRDYAPHGALLRALNEYATGGWPQHRRAEERVVL